MMRTSDQGLAFIVAHEGVVPAPYFDSVGVPTFGIGHTASAGPPDPEGMARGMPLDLDEALTYAFEVFRRDLPRFEAGVNRVLNGRTVPQHEYDAAVSFHFNTGAIAHAEWVKEWLAGRKDAAAAKIMNWRKPASIIERREAERDLFLRGTYGSRRAAVWPVGANGTPVWRPIRTLTQAQIVNLVRPSAPPAPRPVVLPRPVEPRQPSSPPSNAIGWIFTLIGAAIAAALVLGDKL